MSPVHSYYLVSDFQVFPFLLRYLKILFNILKWCVQKRPSINRITIYLSPSKLKKKKKKGSVPGLLFSSTYHSTLPSPIGSEIQLKSNDLSIIQLPCCCLSHSYCILDYWSHFKFFSLFLLLSPTIHFSLGSHMDH